ncbi:MAG: RNA-binding protein [Chloroflexi bacterium]|nr:RNA-binding protein [Chloroflexota bacterium]
MTNIYVGNLPWSTTETDLRGTFEAYGTVTDVSIIKDRNTGRSRGFGFVEMDSADEAAAAINGLNGKEMEGRDLKVNEARPREDNRGGGFRRERRW